MRIPSFRVERKRGVSLAACDRVPRLMVIAGPNGSGKSTLLQFLRTQPGTGPILYVGPHRDFRRQQVQQRYLFGSQLVLADLLSAPSLPSYEGIRIWGGSREPWDFDETGNYLKHSLCQLEIERQSAIAEHFDRYGEIRKDIFPDIWQPLRELTSNLLPHLSFHKIDSSNRSQISCLWKVHSKDTLVDLDDLSSGEKSIIQMFYPLLEQRIRARLSDIRGAQSVSQSPEICVLIDEPELHLHPNLQVKVFDYLRLLTSEDRTQIIIATHSQTIVEYATFDELFLLRPVELLAAGDNQLIQVASSEERLHFLRDIFGTTSNVTALQPVVVVEGSEQTDKSKAISDRKLYRALHQSFDRVTLVPGGGISECLKLVNVLQEAFQLLSPQLKAISLLDRDTCDSSTKDGAYLLPVSMIENFLVDPNTIWEAIQSIIEKTNLHSPDDVAAAIDKILEQRHLPEIERRTIQRLGAAVYRPKPPLPEITTQVQNFVEELHKTFAATRIEDLRKQAEAAVADLNARKQRREMFDGKAVMEEFFKTYLHTTGMAKGIFFFEAARHARNRKSVTSFFADFFKQLGVE